MSSNFGGAADTCASASRNMVWQNGQAAPTIPAPVATSSSARSTWTRFPFSSPKKASPPPAPQQRERFRARGGSLTSPASAVTALRIVRTHASQRKAILLRAVVKGKLALLQELLPLARGEAHRIAIAFQVEEQLGSIVVLPFAGVHRSAPQPDDDGDVLDSHR